MTLLLSTRLTVSPDTVGNAVEGKLTILNTRTERFFDLDEIASAMWNALITSDSIQAALNALVAEYDVEPDRLCNDLREFAGAMIEHGLLEVGDR